MTTRQLILMNCFYLTALVAIAYFTRATSRRIAGALAGGAASGLAALGVIAVGEAMRWWQVPISFTPYFLALLYFGLVISCAPIYLVSWRIARRFRSRGLAALVGVAAVVGPLRDYQVSARYPEWIDFGPGVVPVLAVAVTYAVTVGLGHAVMGLVAGPAGGDRLARRRRDAA